MSYLSQLNSNFLDLVNGGFLMKISDKTIEDLAKIIIGDVKLQDYRSGNDLVCFFNKLGFEDQYGQGIPSRFIYTKNKLYEINNS